MQRHKIKEACKALINLFMEHNIDLDNFNNRIKDPHSAESLAFVKYIRTPFATSAASRAAASDDKEVGQSATRGDDGKAKEPHRAERSQDDKRRIKRIVVDIRF